VACKRLKRASSKEAASKEISTMNAQEAVEGRTNQVTIIVNGRPKVVEDKRLSFEEVVRLAFPDAVFGPDFEYTVTYTKGPFDNHEGTLIPGQAVKVKEGMIFNVTQTNKS
jgi:hypothetical protein